MKTKLLSTTCVWFGAGVCLENTNTFMSNLHQNKLTNDSPYNASWWCLMSVNKSWTHTEVPNVSEAVNNWLPPSSTSSWCCRCAEMLSGADRAGVPEWPSSPPRGSDCVRKASSPLWTPPTLAHLRSTPSSLLSSSPPLSTSSLSSSSPSPSPPLPSSSALSSSPSSSSSSP